MSERLSTIKTWKLFIGGAFPRSESGRSLPVAGGSGQPIAYIAHASRKDLREAVEKASAAQPGWAERSGYNRGQILYRLAEMLEGRRGELERSLADAGTADDAPREVGASIDRVIAYAGWCDKFSQLLGCANSVSGPYHNFTVPEPVGVVCIFAPDRPALLGPITLLAAALCAGNTVVLVAGDAAPVPTLILAECCPTSDIPAGVVNVLTGKQDELIAHAADHGDIALLASADLSPTHTERLRLGTAENMKRQLHLAAKPDEWFDNSRFESPDLLGRFLEMKTLWHPSAY